MPISRALLVASLFVSSVTFADVDARFAKLRDSAEPVGGLGAFLEKFIGDCDALSGAECRANSQAFRSKMTGKKMYMIVGEDDARMLAPGMFDANGGKLEVLVTPFFSANGYGLSQGVPRKVDANGNPIMSYLIARGEAQPEWGMGRFQRMFSSRELRMQVVFTPQGVWQLAGKGGKKLQGVRAKIDAVLITVGRTGDQVAFYPD